MVTAWQAIISGFQKGDGLQMDFACIRVFTATRIRVNSTKGGFSMRIISTRTKLCIAVCSAGVLLAAGLTFSTRASAGQQDELAPLADGENLQNQRQLNGPVHTSLSSNGWWTFTVEAYLNADSYRQVNVDPNEKLPNFDKGDISYIEGVLYPKGTLQGGLSDPPDGARTIGTYRYRGVNTGSLDDFQNAEKKLSVAPRILGFMTETYGFPDDDSELITEGGWPNAYFGVHRAVIGGTGRFAGMVGETWEENIGESRISGQCNLRVHFKLRQVR
jgi:hypothetical protein